MINAVRQLERLWNTFDYFLFYSLNKPSQCHIIMCAREVERECECMHVHACVCSWIVWNQCCRAVPVRDVKSNRRLCRQSLLGYHNNGTTPLYNFAINSATVKDSTVTLLTTIIGSVYLSDVIFFSQF